MRDHGGSSLLQSTITIQMNVRAFRMDVQKKKLNICLIARIAINLVLALESVSLIHFLHILLFAFGRSA